jgi:hypothetical protein
LIVLMRYTLVFKSMRLVQALRSFKGQSTAPVKKELLVYQSWYTGSEQPQAVSVGREGS